MPTLNRRPKLDPAALYVCLESYGAADGSCRAGTRLLGSHPKVVQRPAYFAPVDTPDDQLEELRRALYPDYQRLVR